jgi:hypothetical protein
MAAFISWHDFILYFCTSNFESRLRWLGLPTRESGGALVL